jgi:hypothetical protein
MPSVVRALLLAVGLTFATAAVAPPAGAATLSTIITVADFPAGWRTTPVTAADSTAADTAACRDLAAQQGKSLTTFGTPKFVDPHAPSELDLVAATVTTMPSAAAATEQVDALLRRQLLRCLSQSTDQSMETAYHDTTATTTVRRLHLPHRGARVSAVEAKTRVTGRDHFAYTQQIVFVREGKHIATLHVNTVGKLDYTALRDRLIDLIRKRLSTEGAVSV